ncbi:UREF-like protein [Mya arenaria]|uniref:UREF-like protein n=1 Tax=Mya arenaria TaxID=6604 RepID=A0ABY7FWM1_MYAAR|nr:uncharacterized protein LOC128218253 [Mya arenaria]WAR25452.1 UREF-like protein [Mya arenaria]
MSHDESLLYILQLSDSGFPTGGFSHSGGLEAALKVNYISEKDSLKTYFNSCLENIGSFMVPFMRDAYRLYGEMESLVRLDRLCEACTPNHVARRASSRQGSSLLDTSQRVFSVSSLVEVGDNLPCKHLPVVYGVVCASLGVDIHTATVAFIFTGIRTMVASSVRLDLLGPIEAQAVQRELQKEIPAVIERHKQRSSEDACMLFPQADICQNTHDTMFTKLFYS